MLSAFLRHSFSSIKAKYINKTTVKLGTRLFIRKVSISNKIINLLCQFINFTFAGLILRLGLSIKIMLLRGFGGNLSLNKVHIRTKLFSSLLLVSLIRHKVRNTLISFTENRIFDFHILSLFSFKPFSFDAFNLFLELGNASGSRFGAFKEIGHRIFNILTSGTRTSFLCLSFLKINLGVSQTLLVTHHLRFSNSTNKIVTRRTTVGIRRRRTSGIRSNTSTTGRITEDISRRNTSGTPTSGRLHRAVFISDVINHFLLILLLKLHITLIVALLSARINRIRKLVESKVTSGTGKTCKNRHIVQFFYLK